MTDAAKDAIITKGYDQAYGARPLRREIQNQIEDALAERMLQGSFEAGRHGHRRPRPRMGRSASSGPHRPSVRPPRLHAERAIDRAVSAR